jgi:pectin methylesterase-like acyl-CoA thioesterase
MNKKGTIKNTITRYPILFMVWIALVLSVNLSLAQNGVKYPVTNATNVCTDTQFKLSFAATPVIQSAGTIKLFKSDGTLVETIDLSQTPSGVPTAATWPWKQTYSGSIVNVIKIIIEDKTAIISFAIGAMTYNSSYYVTVDQNIFSNAAALGFSGITANQWFITTKTTAPIVDNDYTVASDDTGDFASLQAALDYIPTSNSTKTKIYVKNGIYVGLLSSKTKNNITIEGESVDGVIIKAYNNAIMNTTVRYSANFTGNDNNFINLTFINTTPNGGSQAETISLSGNQNVIFNCKFFSYQDTVLISGKTYLKDCLIEGNVDFIWGNGTVFFQSCEIRTAIRSGYIVQARNSSANHGYAFADCKITSTSSAANGSVLGRDPGTTTATNVYYEIVYLNCTLGSHISSLGWNTSRLTTAQAATTMYAEYKSVDPNGNLINVSGRDPNSKQLTDVQNAQYRDLNWFFNGWTPVLPIYSLNTIGPRGTLEKGFKLYPNPVTNLVSIELGNENTSDTIIQLFDIEGKLITNENFQGATHILNMDNLHSGLYMVKVSNANGNVVKRIIKQ